MFRYIDNVLNRITMYRLVLYYLTALWVIALGFSVFGILPFEPISMIISAVIIVAACWITNTLFAKIFNVPANIESVYITAFILMLIITPPRFGDPYSAWLFLIWASVFAMISKFILAIGKKHIFNPAAIAVVLTAFIFGQYASWWLGTLWMLPFVLVGGLLVVRKIIRWDLVLSFLAVALISIVYFGLARGSSPLVSIQKSMIDSPLFFFAAIMLTEPLTTPPTRGLRMLYGALVGALFAPALHIGSVSFTPELALVTGNIFSYLASPKAKLSLTLKEKIQTAPGLVDFVFTSDKPLKFQPGQYLEWTLGYTKPDDRGNRRYFTIASSPTEPTIRLGVRFYPKPSTFKQTLDSLKIGDTIVAGQLAGDFTLPHDPKKKLVLIAGGVGITPFRSMLKYLTDKNEYRDIILLYSAKTPAEHIYRDVFEVAHAAVGVKTIYVANDIDGFITADTIKRDIPDYQERMFYLSGPRSMVVAFQDSLQKLGIHRNHIKTDFFPGLV